MDSENTLDESRVTLSDKQEKVAMTDLLALAANFSPPRPWLAGDNSNAIIFEEPISISEELMSEEFGLICGQCNKVFQRNDALRRHQKKQHGT